MTRAMKDSGIEWIGQIPEDWKISKYKYYSDNRMGETILVEDTNTEEGVPIYSATQDDKILGYVKNPSLVLHKGDFVIPARGNSIGCVSVVKEDVATCTQTTICSRNIKNINKDFLFYCSLGLHSEWFKYEGSTIPQVTVNQIKNNLVPIPSMSEQQKIADFLDKKCSHIDSILEKTKASIDECKQLKQSVITQAVTKGIRPNRPMKDSGIEWIGQIPEDWGISKIKFVAKFNPQYTVQTKENDIVTFAPMECIKNGYYNSKEAVFQSSNNSYTPFQEGDIVIAKVTPCFENGNIAIMENLYSGYGYGSSELFVLRPFNIETRFLFYYLQNESFKKMGCSTMTGTGGLKRVSPTFVQNYPIPHFNKTEQNDIVNYLDVKCTEIDKLITKKEQLIKELETYKKSLIYEYVTGKKEVI